MARSECKNGDQNDDKHADRERTAVLGRNMAVVCVCCIYCARILEKEWPCEGMLFEWLKAHLSLEVCQAILLHLAFLICPLSALFLSVLFASSLLVLLPLLALSSRLLFHSHTVSISASTSASASLFIAGNSTMLHT